MSMRSPSGFIRPGFDPLKNPDAPTIGAATGADVSASITFTAPAGVGGSAITSYLATARKTSDGTLTSVSGASSPIVVTSLTNGAAYTATVAAVNSYGPSAASAASNSVTPANPAPTVIGQSFGGGYYAGQISTAANSVADYYIIVGPAASAENASMQWKNSNSSATGADSVIDGPQNTADMVAEGTSTVYPAAHFCNNLTIGGFTDWYMPAQDELEVCYYNLKPTTTNNTNSTGANYYAVPSRGSPYTNGTPARTAATIFQSTGAETFTTTYYWSSTERTGSYSWAQTFQNGFQYGNYLKNTTRRVRAIRRVAV